MTKRAAEIHYTDAIATEICERLGDGETLSEICEDDHMPTRRAVFYWVDDRPEFAGMYATARIRQAECHYDKLVRAAETAKGLTDNAAVQAYRLFIDTLKWACSRLRPEVYAERTSKTVVLDVGSGYAALLEQIDERKRFEALTINGMATEVQNTDSASLPRAPEPSEEAVSVDSGSPPHASDATGGPGREANGGDRFPCSETHTAQKSPEKKSPENSTDEGD